MVWLIALVCLGLCGLTGFYSGPIRTGFSLIGLFFGAILAGPLSPLTQKLLPILGLKNPIWQLFIPQAIAFVIVVIIFIVAGVAVHRKIAVHFKYNVDDKKLIAWERLYSRTGLCIGLANGAVYFFLLLVPIYVGGYFTAEAATESNNPAGARLLTKLRDDLHHQNLDRVAAGFDPTPKQVYQASDILDLIMHNPLLKSRIAHYPPLLTLGQRPEFQALGNDVQLLEMIDRQASISELLNYPAIHAIVTNPDVIKQIYGILGNDLNDLQEYLTTGKSPKFADEPILGVWDINTQETIAQVRKTHPDIKPRELGKMKQELIPLVRDLSLTATTDNQMFLKKQVAGNTTATVVASGTWKRDGSDYEVTLPGSKPETTEVQIQESDTLLLPKDGYVLVFDKEM